MSAWWTGAMTCNIFLGHWLQASPATWETWCVRPQPATKLFSLVKASGLSRQSLWMMESRWTWSLLMAQLFASTLGGWKTHIPILWAKTPTARVRKPSWRMTSTQQRCWISALMVLSFPCSSRIIVIKKQWPKSTLQTGCMPLHPMLEALWTTPVTWPRVPACLTLDHCWRTSTRTGSPGIPHWRFQNSVDRNCWRMRICKSNSSKPWWRQALPWSQILASPRASRMWIVANLWKTLCFPSLGESISILFEQHALVWSIQKQLLLKIPLTMIARTHPPCTQTTRTTTAHLATCSSCTKLVDPWHPKFAMAWPWRNISGKIILKILRCWPRSMWHTPSETVPWLCLDQFPKYDSEKVMENGVCVCVCVCFQTFVQTQLYLVVSLILTW